uniref:Uncharacterized protein n=1 Tax=Salarias fasciatus TaxID=181472 RepID=A0A672GKD3_SALFA
MWPNVTRCPGAGGAPEEAQGLLPLLLWGVWAAVQGASSPPQLHGRMKNHRVDLDDPRLGGAADSQQSFVLGLKPSGLDSDLHSAAGRSALQCHMDQLPEATPRRPGLSGFTGSPPALDPPPGNRCRSR